ncbi:MAG: 30S ribosomal protein S15 [Candidatus Bathyarchaeia archaeon]
MKKRAHARGRSHSKRPISKRSPSWCTYTPDEVEALVVKLGRQMTPPSMIGVILRDQYGIPLVKNITGKSVTEILREHGLEPNIPEDLASLLKKAERLKKHLDVYKSDGSNKRALQLIESKIHKLAKYYKSIGRLPEDWSYKTAILSAS